MQNEHSPRAVHAFVLGLASVHGLFVLGPAALLLAVLELGAIRAGDAPRGGERLARVAVALGGSAIAIPLSALLVWLWVR